MKFTPATAPWTPYPKVEKCSFTDASFVAVPCVLPDVRNDEFQKRCIDALGVEPCTNVYCGNVDQTLKNHSFFGMNFKSSYCQKCKLLFENYSA